MPLLPCWHGNLPRHTYTYARPAASLEALARALVKVGGRQGLVHGPHILQVPAHMTDQQGWRCWPSISWHAQLAALRPAACSCRRPPRGGRRATPGRTFICICSPAGGARGGGAAAAYEVAGGVPEVWQHRAGGGGRCSGRGRRRGRGHRPDARGCGRGGLGRGGGAYAVWQVGQLRRVACCMSRVWVCRCIGMA